VTAFFREVLLVRRNVRERLELIGQMAGRTSPGPMLVRGTVFGSGLVALALAAPTDLLLHGWGGVLLLLPALPALRPRGLLVTLVALTTVVFWLASTTAYGQPVTVWRLIGVAGAMYVMHTSAALAAVLPYDTVVAMRVLVAWLWHAGAVVLATAAFCLAALVGVPMLGNHSYLLASIGGLATMVGLAWLLAILRGRMDG
jgi:hypothetical protein